MRLLAALLLALAALALPAAAQRLEPLPPAQAFAFAAAMEDGEVVVRYDMPDGIYLYQDRIQLTTATPGVRIAALALPPGTPHEDEFFGRTTVYYGGVTLRAAVAGSGGFTLLARIQGCDEQIGICYPPLENTIALVASGSGDVSADAAQASDDASAAYRKDEAGYLSQGIASNSIFWTVAVFFLLGVGLSFTPCVLPMLPILLGIIGGGGKSRRQIIVLTATYISGVALAFTLFGILAALSGQLLSQAFQTPWVLGGVAGLFALLALSLFGAYDLRLPAALHRRLDGISGGGGAFAMGAVSAVAVSPCVAAPLIGALLYIGTSGDVLLGGAALLSLALGMSVLLAAAGVVGGSMLPRAGEWTDRIKQLFGALMLGVAVWVASPLLPETLQLLLYGLLLGLAGSLLLPAAGASGGALPHLLRIAALAALLWGAAMIIGAAGGSRDVLTPLSPFTRSAASEEESALQFRPVTSLAEVQQLAASAGRPVVLDFYADWCVSCKEFERFTLRDARVIARLQDALLLRADVTANSAADRELLAHYGLYGPPAILFFRRDGALLREVRVIGYENAGAFLQTLAAAGI